MPRILDGRITDAQLEALRLAANGHTARRIARQLAVSEDAVNLRLTAAARSLGAASRAHLVALALVRGLLTADDIHDTRPRTTPGRNTA